ncbi:MAG: hypothetical protein GTO02_12065, partial [Candidatus Dadabacteria bacterium]|nr:hypothetical protein [Candidatus Dadabacteria bacterium]NIQ15088.1 hypothetical protein [Candidatus Dadabacteria bacterium]
IFDIDDEATGEKIVEIKGLRLINGHADNDKELETEPDICPGGAIFNAEDLTIDSCEFEDNVAEGGNGCSYGNGKGGAIFNAPSPPPDMPMSLTVTNTKFTNNHADGEGGAIYNYETVIDEISFCTFLNNSANHAGGAIYNGYGSIITKIQNSVFNGNNSPWGGAIANYNSDIVDIHMSNFTGNYSYGGGGAIYNSTGADDDDDAEIMLIDNSNFNFNKALFSGGAILNYKDGEGPYKGVIWKIDNTDFNNNSAGPQGLPLLLKTSSKEYIGDDDDDGGAISNINAIIHEILNSKFDGNEANTEFEGIPVKTFGGQGAGGAIYNYGYDSELLVDLSLIGSILYSTFSNNSAHEGGAIFNGIGGGPSVEAKILTINKSTFNNNSADHGTGIFNESKIPVINNSTFNSNGTDENGIEECGVEDINCLENLCTLCEGIEDCILCAFFECGCSFDECGVEDFICLDNNCDLCDGEECVECAFFECGCLLEEPPLPPRSIARESNEGSPPGAYEGFFNSHANISFSTFSENLVGINLYGDDDDDDAELNIINSIVANSSILNCVINGYLMDFGGNHEDFLGFNGQTCFEQPPSLITLGPLADNGGPTQTVELIAGDPIDGANGSLDDDDDCVGFQASMAEDYYAPVTVLTDQRGANRPDGSECDSGAYETGLLHSVTITKLTIPPGG